MNPKEDDQQIFVVGSNFERLFLNNDDNFIKQPQQIIKYNQFDPSEIIQISSSIKHVVAITHNGEVITWGENENGQIGRSSMLRKPTIMECMDNYKVIQVAVSDGHSALLTSEGKLFCFGSNLFGESGDLDIESKTVTKPKLIKINEPISQVSVGRNFTLSLTIKGNLYGFGNGWIGNGDQIGSRKPVIIDTLQGVPILCIESGVEHTLVLTKSGQVYSFGNGSFGALGHSNLNSERRPKRISFFSSTKIKKIATGDYHSVVLSEDGKVFSFGKSNFGELGDRKSVV